MSRAELIRTTVQDLVTDFLHYDRDDDEELPRGAIEEAIKEEEISLEEIVNTFHGKLIAYLT